MKTYLVIIKNNSLRFTSTLELSRALATARETFPQGDWHSDSRCELDSLCRMHLHTMVKFPTNISCRRYTQKWNHGSWHINFQPIKKSDVDYVHGYVMKEKCPSICEEISREHHLQRKLKYLDLFKYVKNT